MKSSAPFSGRQGNTGDRAAFIIRSSMFLSLLLVRLPAQQRDTVALHPVVSAHPVDTLITLDKLTVTAAKQGTASAGYRCESARLGPLGELPLGDIPFSIAVTSGESIENRGSHKLSDALMNNPTAAPVQQPATDGRGQSELCIRGFDPFYLYNNLPVRNMLPVPVEDLDRIEVINGLTGAFYPFGSPGGSVNFITKTPTYSPLATVSTGMHNGGVGYIHTDLSAPLDTSNRFSGRATAYLEDGRSFIADATQHNARVSATVNARVTDSTIITAMVSHQEVHLRGQQVAFAVDPSTVTVPAAEDFDPSVLYGQPWSFVKGKQEMFGAGFESRPDPRFKITASYLHSMLWRKNNGVSATLINDEGAYREVYSDGAPQDIGEHSAHIALYADLPGQVVSNHLSAGWMIDRYIQENNPSSVRNVLIDTSDIAFHTYAPMPQKAASTEKTQKTDATYMSVHAADRLSWRFISLLASVNYASYSYEKIDPTPASAIPRYTQGKVTPGIALLVKPFSAISIYGSFIQGLIAGSYVTDATAANFHEDLPPGVSNQYEAGVKTTVAKRLDATAALFRIDKVNEYKDPADSRYKQDGRELHQGLEVTLTGKTFDWLTIGGGGTVMDAHVEKATNTSIEGKTPANIPERQARAFVEVQLPPVTGLSVSAGVNYTGLRRVDDRNSASIPSVKLYDAGVRYRTAVGGHTATLSATITNLLDTPYWAAYKPRGTVGLCLGAPRTISVSAGVGL